MIGWDRQLESWVVGHRIGALDPVFRGITYSGESGAIWLLLAAILAFVTRKWQVLAWVAVANLTGQLTTMLIQIAVGRDRPHVQTLVPEPHSHSFPSAHAASSFACAVVLATFAPRFRIPFFVLAALIAISRVYVGVHFSLDVLAGAAWGVLIGKATLDVRGALASRREPRLPAT
jgi:undecaprenyl-diphosphatase